MMSCINFMKKNKQIIIWLCESITKKEVTQKFGKKVEFIEILLLPSPFFFFFHDFYLLPNVLHAVILAVQTGSYFRCYDVGFGNYSCVESCKTRFTHETERKGRKNIFYRNSESASKLKITLKYSQHEYYLDSKLVSQQI